MIQAAVPIAVTVVGATAALFAKRRKKRRGMTPERVKIYEAALISLKDAPRLETLAAAFQSEGLTEQAKLLRQRAALNAAPAEQKIERRRIFRQALCSRDPKAVVSVAAAFDKMGATGAAFTLRQYAAAIIKLGPNASDEQYEQARESARSARES